MEKRMAGDYEIIHAFHIGDKEIVIGENIEADEGIVDFYHVVWSYLIKQWPLISAGVSMPKM